MTFQITVQITPEALQLLQQSGQSIGTAFDNGNNPNLIWTTQRPAPQLSFPGPNNWGLFASTSQLVSGAVIQIMTALNQATEGNMYPYSQTGFGSPNGNAPNGTIGVQNQTNTVLVGLIGNNSPATATSVREGQTVALPVPNAITFFVTTEQAGSVMASVPSQNIQVNTQNTPNATLIYDVTGWSMQ
ncbi:MAG: hypothetical protein KDC71_22515 [Acidobacteria bacterium]|nr:hypothetical protein [Acidobacteriota bacterium]